MTQNTGIADSLRKSGLADDFLDQVKAIEEAKAQLANQLIQLVERLDTADRRTWGPIVVAAGEVGVSDEEIQTELGTSISTVQRWREEDVAPREGTRRLMKATLLNLIRRRTGLPS